jgi:hypothetical protein
LNFCSEHLIITAKGNATKHEIIAAVKQKGFYPETDDEADEIAIMLLALDSITSKDQNKKRYYKALGESGSQDPATSLASEFFRGLTPERYLKASDSKKNKSSV